MTTITTWKCHPTGNTSVTYYVASEGDYLTTYVAAGLTVCSDPFMLHAVGTSTGSNYEYYQTTGTFDYDTECRLTANQTVLGGSIFGLNATADSSMSTDTLYAITQTNNSNPWYTNCNNSAIHTDFYFPTPLLATEVQVQHRSTGKAFLYYGMVYAGDSVAELDAHTNTLFDSGFVNRGAGAYVSTPLSPTKPYQYYRVDWHNSGSDGGAKGGMIYMRFLGTKMQRQKVQVEHTGNDATRSFVVSAPYWSSGSSGSSTLATQNDASGTIYGYVANAWIEKWTGTTWETLFNPAEDFVGTITGVFAAPNNSPYAPVYICGTSGRISRTTAADLGTWQAMQTDLSSSAIYDMTLGDDGFVAVGSSGNILHSRLGTTWSSIDRIVTRMLYSVAYGNDCYVACGASGAVLRSESGSAGWSIVADDVFVSLLYVVRYLNNKFFMSGEEGLFTSLDGENWTLVSEEVKCTSSSGSGIAWDGNQTLVVSTGSSSAYVSTDGGNTWQKIDAVNQTTYGVAYSPALNLWLITAYYGAYTSSNGTDWTFHEPTFSNLYSTIWSAGRGCFIARTGTSGIAFSTDGIDWRAFPQKVSKPARTSNISSTGAIRAVGTSGLYVDPVTKTIENVGGSDDLLAVQFGDDRCVILGTNKVYVSTSTGYAADSFTAYPAPFNGQQNALAFGNGLFVCVGNSGSIWSSVDGIDWTLRLSGSLNYSNVAYANGVFVACQNGGSSSTSFAYSSDGENWITYTPNIPAPYSVSSIRSNGNEFALWSGPALYTSQNGYSWQLQPHGIKTNYTGTDLAWDGSHWIGYIQSNYVTNATYAYRYCFPRQYTSAGTAWTTLDLSSVSTNNTLGIALSPNAGVIAKSGGVVLSSSDLVTWTAKGPYGSEDLNAAAFSGSYWFVVGNAGTLLYSSNSTSAPTSWTQRNLSTTKNLLGVVYGARWVVVGSSGALFSGTNYSSLVERTSGTTNGLRAVAYSPELQKYIVGGANGTLLLCRSSDAVTWEVLEPVTTQTLYSACYGAHGFVVAGGNGTLLHSVDGENWTNNRVDYNYVIPSVVWDGLRYRAFSGGYYWESYDGVNWSDMIPTNAYNLRFGAYSAGRYLTAANNSLIGTSTRPLGIYSPSLAPAHPYAHYNGTFYPISSAPAGAYPITDNQYFELVTRMNAGGTLRWYSNQRPYITVAWQQPVMTANTTSTPLGNIITTANSVTSTQQPYFPLRDPSLNQDWFPNNSRTGWWRVQFPTTLYFTKITLHNRQAFGNSNDYPIQGQCYTNSAATTSIGPAINSSTLNELLTIYDSTTPIALTEFYFKKTGGGTYSGISNFQGTAYYITYTCPLVTFNS